MERRVLLFTLAGSLGLIAAAQASPIRTDGLGLSPDGIVSYANQVLTYDSMGLASGPWSDPTNALGASDYANHSNFTSLGVGGSLVLGFGNRALTGSGTSAPDLVVSEVGPDVEDMFAYVSGNGIDWQSLGRVAGGTTGVDLDSFGFGVNDAFSFVKLVDDPNQGLRTGATAGADIDAVAVVNSDPPPVPEPGTMVLMATGLVGLAARRKWINNR